MSKQIFGHETSTLYVNQSNQNWSVDIGGSIEVANGHGMVNYAPYSHSVMTTSGEIIADGMYKDGMYSEGIDAILQVDTMGSIHGYNGIAFYGEGTYAENLGTITAANVGIYGNAKDMDIVNKGTITAKTGLYVENAQSHMSSFQNFGTITADKGIVALNGGVNITNAASGVIYAKTTAITLALDKNNSANIHNEGLIHSDDVAILGSAGNDSITNAGAIEGRILLGDGDDFFRNTIAGTTDQGVDGGLGDDSYGFAAGVFEIIDAGGEDTIGSTITRSLVPYNNIENLTLEGPDNINGTGNALANKIYGNEANNILDGGNDNLVDTLVGRSGNDTYILGSGNDLIFESAENSDPYSNEGGGIDTITSTISRSLADYDYVENLKLLGTGNINGTGNDLANVITGTSGNNILDGGQEDSDVIDTLNGGKGNDTYVLFTGHDKVIDSAGIDTITSEISRSLADYPTIENLTLFGKDNLSGTGNALVNVITGNDGNNILDGGVDTVVDTLAGGAGDDTYVLGSGSDKVVETTGTDTITSTVTRGLAGYANVENLTLKGTADINATGNALANILTGNDGDNILNGGTDTVADVLKGGLGNDTYILGAGDDIVSDSGGTDTITSSISRSLMNYSTIENLTLTGSGNINATGNALANVLTGNSGMNTLDGGGGNDTYVLGSGSDKVVDSAGTDTISSTISRDLGSFAMIENLKLLGTSNISATGNALSNTLTGNSGLNSLSGGAGNDVLIGGAGADKLDGGANTDTASYSGASAGVVANLAKSMSNTGDAKGDTYISIENLIGSSHNDTLTGNTVANVLTGGAGADKLTGGSGADTFLFKSVGDSTVALAGQDLIFDFSHSQGDRISLVGIDADSMMSGNQVFLFKGTAAFSGANGELRFEKMASDTYIYGDINGDKIADFAIHLDTAVTLQAGDFLL